MPKRFYFVINNTLHWSEYLESAKCQRCSRNTIIGIGLCWQHTVKEKKLRIRKSTIGDFDGLFAQTTIRTPAEIGDIVFRKDDNIIEYAGQHIDQEERDKRYGNKTAPYAIEVRDDEYIDAALYRSTAALANTARGSGKRNNARLVTYVRNGLAHAALKATRHIRDGEEILCAYGAAYRFDARFHTSTANRRRPG